ATLTDARCGEVGGSAPVVLHDRDAVSGDVHGAAERAILAHHVLVVATARPLVVEGAQALGERPPHRAAGELEGPAVEREALVFGEGQFAAARVVEVLVRPARGSVVARAGGRVGLELGRAAERRLAVARAVPGGLGHAEGQVVVALCETRGRGRRGSPGAVRVAEVSWIRAGRETGGPGARRRKPDDPGREAQQHQGSDTRQHRPHSNTLPSRLVAATGASTRVSMVEGRRALAD